ncbi:hypothetical protein GF312_11920 [Candidatus Poribacteria bacterium]|nr:hypothetical protein [Candidatus Poribacteria bacterium]
MKIRDIFNDIEIKLICLLLSIVMWLYASNPRGTEAIDNFMSIISRDNEGLIILHKVPIQISGLEEKINIEPKIIEDLQVKTSAAELDLDDFQIIVNLSQKDMEKGKIKLSTNNVKLPDGLSFIKAQPGEIQLTE